jgi:hypothetical protein
LGYFYCGARLLQPGGNKTEVRLTSFKVAIVERGKEALWRNYWINSDSEGSADAAPFPLGRTELVEARNVDDAIASVQREHPDCTVMLAGGEHHDN